MTMTEYPASLAEAMAVLQTRLPDVNKSKTAKIEKKTGGHYSYKYADLAAVAAAILPLLGEVGLSFLAKPTINASGKFVLVYKLLHVSKDEEIGEYPLPQNGSPQEIGSAITYARRYTLCAVTGVVPDEDDDGAAAEEAHKERESWENATPAIGRGQQPVQTQQQPAQQGQPTVAQRIANGRKAIAEAQNTDTLNQIRDLVDGYHKDGTFSPENAEAMHDEINAREIVLANSAPGATPTQSAPVPDGPMMTDPTKRLMFKRFNELGMQDRTKQMVEVRRITGRQMESRNELRESEAVAINKELERMQVARALDKTVTPERARDLVAAAGAK
jgi:hypothetical protein